MTQARLNGFRVVDITVSTSLPLTNHIIGCRCGDSAKSAVAEREIDGTVFRAISKHRICYTGDYSRGKVASP
jgi:hypothetical protein